MHPKGTSEAFGAWRKAAGLRQPHIQVQPHDRSRGHLMQIYLKQPKDVHYHGVEGHPKTGGEQIAEHDHFVCTRMSDGLTRRWSPDTVRRDEAPTSQVVEEGRSSLTSRVRWSSALLIDSSSEPSPKIQTIPRSPLLKCSTKKVRTRTSSERTFAR